MVERRYTDDEVRAILASAAERDEALPGAEPEGWTLAEIQSAGAAVGMSPTAIAVAAHAHERTAVAPREPRLLGLPLSVDRAVPLARPLNEGEWRRLVAELRQTFEAEGRERVDGARREWRNGNLRVIHETVGEGALLEMRTRRGDTRAIMNFAGVMTLTSAAMAAANLVLAAGDAKMLGVAVAMGAAGLATSAVSAIRLPPWARRRAEQFDALGAFARRLAGE